VPREISGGLLSPKDVADLLGVPYTSIYALIHRWGLPAFKFGKHLRVRQEDLEQWLETKRVEIPDDSPILVDLLAPRRRGRPSVSSARHNRQTVSGGSRTAKGT